MLSFSNAKKGGQKISVKYWAVHLKLICLIQPVDILYQALILFQKKRGTEEWDKCRTNEKARREASLSESVFFVLGTYCCFNFPYRLFGGQETDSKWRTRIGRPSDPQNNHLNLKRLFKPVFISLTVPVWLVVLLSWSSKLRPLGKTFSPSLNTKWLFKVNVKWLRHLVK